MPAFERLRKSAPSWEELKKNLLRKVTKMTRTVIKIGGMACGMCEAHINDAIRQNFDIKKTESSHTKGETVVVSGEPLDEAALRRVIENTGYEVKSIESGAMPEKKGFFSKLFG